MASSAAQRPLKNLLGLIMLASFTCAAARAEAGRPLFFLRADSVDIHTALPAPPKPNSPQDKHDIEIIESYQAKRSADDCKRASSEARPSLSSLFGPPYGPLNEGEVNRLDPLFSEVLLDSDYFVQATKRLWERPRPYQHATGVKPCVKLEKTYAYPSGHAALGVVFADLLAKIYPAKAAAFYERAKQIATDRVMAGVHHPTDIEEGRNLGQAIVKEFLKNESFVKKINELRATAASSPESSK